MLAIIEENKGLRKGLQEILDFLKDNSMIPLLLISYFCYIKICTLFLYYLKPSGKTSSGILTLQCPSLEAILLSMEARDSAGWFAPHMSAMMELRTALGGKDALLTALHEARYYIHDKVHSYF